MQHREFRSSLSWSDWRVRLGRDECAVDAPLAEELRGALEVARVDERTRRAGEHDVARAVAGPREPRCPPADGCCSPRAGSARRSIGSGRCGCARLAG